MRNDFLVTSPVFWQMTHFRLPFVLLFCLFPEHVSSVDILKLNNVFCVDIRDMINKEWRRHCDSSTSCQEKDYWQVAQYRMRSIEDAAEFFALLYKLINAR